VARRSRDGVVLSSIFQSYFYRKDAKTQSVLSAFSDQPSESLKFPLQVINENELYLLELYDLVLNGFENKTA
jgi:hypothetical protein